MTVKKIENHTARFIDLPPILGIETGEEDGDFTDFPNGLRLQPGLNSVPVLYLDALAAQKRVMCDKMGRPRVGKKGEPLYRYPGLEIMAQLIAPVTIVTTQGTKISPQVTVYEDAQVGREDGPAAPLTLPASAAAAKAIIAVTTERAALERWSKATKDSELKIIIATRLAGLR
jgi:hypothetical protein